jgi:hypothetical protein
VLVRLNVQADNTETTAVRFGVATHGGEWSFGVEQHGLQYYGGGLQGGRSWGPQDHTGLSRIAGGGDIGGYGRDETNFKGIMIRSMRRLSDVRLDAPTPTFKHDDAKVRNEMAELQPKVRVRARHLIQQRNGAEAAGIPFNVDIGEEMLRCLADEGMASGLSLGLIHQKTTNHRSDAAAAASFSMTTPGEGGARFGGGGNASVERVWRSKYEQTDTSGAVRIVNHREGSYYRLRSGASVSVNGFYGPAGFPPTDLASRTALLGEIGANAKVRYVYHKDKLVPRFCFSDAEFPDVTSYERYLQAHRDDWIEAFSYKHGGSREDGENELSDHLKLVNDVRAVNHVNYARSRMVENFAKRHDQYRGIGALVPPGMSEFGAELEKARATLSESSDASQLVSGITYAPQAREQALGGALGYRSKEKIKTMTSEREIVFDSPGWAFMQLRENATSARVDPSGTVIKPGASAQQAAAQKLGKGKRVNRAAQDSGEDDPVDHLPV